jgi:putative Holliday junction resolvase
MRYLAIDLGDKRTGLAIGDSETGLATPLKVLDVPIVRHGGEALIAAIVQVVDEHIGPGGDGADESRGEIIIGLPINMDGTEGPRSRAVRVFGQQISRRTGLVVQYQDERLSTADANWDMAGSGLTRKQKKGRRDALAAAVILRDYIAAAGGTGDPSPQGTA